VDSFFDRYGITDISRWSGPALTALRIVLIIVAAWFIAGVLKRMGVAFCGRIAHRLHERDRVKRAETLERVVRYGASVTITLIAAVLILSEIGVAIAPILGAAGVVGLAIGFGAQSLMKDYFTGFFILLENQMITGDVVKIADRTGTVEDVTLRYVRLRDTDGSVHHVPNSEIKVVTNISRGGAHPTPQAEATTAEAPPAAPPTAKKRAAQPA
jgi:small conductance mechanosensitive channel